MRNQLRMVKIGNVELGTFPLLLAPMEDVSDPPFRMLCKQQGADMMYTEFISSEGLIRDAAKSIQKLDIYEQERPVGIQIFGGELDPMIEATRIVEQTQPDVIDINFGCPVKKVVCKDAGAGILRNIPKMVQLTAAVVKATDLPVTVKTRLGWDTSSIQIMEVVERLQDVGIQGISIHGRTRVQMYKGEADWTLIGAIKDNPRVRIPVFGNGDVDSGPKALAMQQKYGVDGVMIGRASIGNPWIFRDIKAYLATGETPPPPTLSDRIEVCRTHLLEGIRWKGEKLGLLEMRRHYANYFKGYKNIKPFRLKLCTSEQLQEILDTLAFMQEADLELISPAVA